MNKAGGEWASVGLNDPFAGREDRAIDGQRLSHSAAEYDAISRVAALSMADFTDIGRLGKITWFVFDESTDFKPVDAWRGHVDWLSLEQAYKEFRSYPVTDFKMIEAFVVTPRLPKPGSCIVCGGKIKRGEQAEIEAGHAHFLCAQGHKRKRGHSQVFGHSIFARAEPQALKSQGGTWEDAAKLLPLGDKL